ncbi:hypothetical protein LguiA_010546 [Lonicera macranthoides]
MASATSTPISCSSSNLIEAKAPRPSAAPSSSQCVSLPTIPRPPLQSQSQSRTGKATVYCRKIARNVAAMATGEAPAEAAATELPEIVKTIQEWDKVEDKYAVTSLGVAIVVGLWVSTGMISAIDRLPLVPGVLELVGIGYTGGPPTEMQSPNRELAVRPALAVCSDLRDINLYGGLQHHWHRHGAG